MDDFKPFYLLILLPLSVILFYFSLKTIILLCLIVVAVLWGTNVVNGSFGNIISNNRSFPLKPKLTKKVIDRKYRTKQKAVAHSRVLNEERRTEMSTIKLTPTPNRSRDPLLRNLSLSSPRPYLRNAAFNNSSSLFERSDGQMSASPNRSSTLKSPAPFLPTIKRALGLSEYLPRQEKPSLYPSYTSYPSSPSPGFIPAVRLAKRERSQLGQQKISAARSSNVVRIAPPEPHKLSSPRLFHIQTSNADQKRTPDTQAVIQALKEKRLKRTYGGYDTSYTDYPLQQAKRRRQDSQQSTSSTSSLPPLPDSLPDLSSTGYTIPRLETPTLKRSAHLVEWEDSCSAKKLRKDGRVNPILSSLSSSQRIAEKEKQVKRKAPMSENKENSKSKSKQAKEDHSGSFSLDRSDTILLPTENTLDTSTVGPDSTVKDKSTSEVSDKPKLDKKITLNESFTARKRQMSLYSGLNKSFQKVPHANVIASMEDYENDMGAERKRVEEMLEGIHQAETEKEKEKEEKEAEEKAKTVLAVVNAAVQSTTTPVVAVQGSTVPTSVTLTVSSALGSLAMTTASGVNSVSPAKTGAANPITFNFATVKNSSPTKASLISLSNISSIAGSVGSPANNTSVTSTIFSTGTISTSSLPTDLSSGVSQTTGAAANPNVSFGLNTTPVLPGGIGISPSSGFNMGNNVAVSTTAGGLNFGNNVAVSSAAGGTFGTTSTTSIPAEYIVNFPTIAPPSYNFAANVSPPSTTKSMTPSGFFGAALTSSGGTTQSVPPLALQPQSTTSFGMLPQATATFGVPQPTLFGQTTTTNITFSTGTNPTPSTSNFKQFGPAQPSQQTATQASIFGQNPPSGNITFGTVATTAASVPGFGGTASSFGQSATSTVASTTGFNFGAGTPSFGNQGSVNFGQPVAQSGSSFGTVPGSGFGTATTQSTTMFGTATTQSGFPLKNDFGATTAANTFGQGPGMFGATTKASSFGQSNVGFGVTVTTSSNAFGTTGSFGQGTTPFGPPKTTTGSTFGASGPSFGQGGSSFGAPATTSAGSFGTTFGRVTPTFGTSTTGATFGTTTPTFGQGSSTFGAASTNAGNTGNFAFGGTTAAQPSNASFNFGSTQGAAPSTPSNKGGFDFSASSTPANTGGFNFSANASFGTPTGGGTPVFGTPTGGGTPNTFNVGAPGSIPKPRVAQRGRRRGARGR